MSAVASSSSAPASAAISTGLGERLVSMSVEATGFTQLPILDLSPILPDSVSSLEERQALALELQAACVDVGFFLIKNHGIDEAVFAEALAQAKAFFDLSMEQKMEVDIKKVSSFKGYTRKSASAARGTGVVGGGAAAKAYELAESGKAMTAADRLGAWYEQR
jgi:hypothetical protein